MLTDKPPLAIEENAVNSSQASLSVSPLRANFPLNACSSETESAFSGAYNNPVDKWSTCIPDAGLEIGIYGNSSSLPSPSHGYGRQLPQRPHAAFETRLPSSLSRNGQLYNAEELFTLDPSYYHFVPPNVPYVAPQNPISQTKLPININPVGESNKFGSRPDHLPSWGSLGGGSNFSGNSRGPKFSWQEVDGFESGGLWSDWSKPLNGKSSLAHLPSVPAFWKQIGSLDLVGNYFGMASRPKESFYGGGSHLGGHSSYLQGERDLDLNYGVVSTSNFGINDRNWPTLDEARRGGRCNDFPCSCTVAVDTIGERNKGPRAFKPRNQKTANGSGNTCRSIVADNDAVSYNRLDFVTDYKEAKFFVIKSYSEDNVHKSIKYGVWASTANGNNKLDAAYREAKEKNGACPVFLLFSVNASAQFCGVAEMVGPVDFDKSVDYWQQAKWSGQFPVKWHIIKDIPNSQFRHIVLESNDNKPVTNSRDTQEVELKLGIEMLKIFKDYESHSSLLDDFHFYEERQKALQAKKSRQRASVESAKVAGLGDGNSVSPSNDLIKKTSKSFAEAVSLSENETKLPFPYMP